VKEKLHTGKQEVGQLVPHEDISMLQVLLHMVNILRILKEWAYLHKTKAAKPNAVNLTTGHFR
jgi:hypothetical protein